MEIEPITRQEKMLNAVANGASTDIKPITREEMFLAKAGGQDVQTPTPITRKEMFLQKIAQNGGSGGSGGDTRKYSTGTYTAAEKTTASAITIAHQLGSVPSRFCWFVVAPETSGFLVSGSTPISFLYADAEKVCFVTGASTGSPNQKHYVKYSADISALYPNEETINLCNGFNISGGSIGAGTTILWFAEA